MRPQEKPLGGLPMHINNSTFRLKVALFALTCSTIYWLAKAIHFSM